MKAKIIYFLCLLSLPALSQTPTEKSKYTAEFFSKRKVKYFEYTPAQKQLIKDNWGMYFKEDVASVLDPDSKSYMFELKMDSYGCLYPEKSILDGITKEEFMGNPDKYSFLEAHSFYWRFKTDPRGKIAEAVKNGKTNPAYKELLQLSKSAGVEEEQKFFEKWDDLHVEAVMKNLNGLIKEKKIKKIIFFIPGYNVPYSLAALQAINIYKLADSLNGMANILFIPVYWPSNNAKECKLDRNNFSIDNIKQYESNGKLFLRYSNRCYYAAATLRRIINKIEDPTVKIDIIAHSLGATIATSCLINTVAKLDYNLMSRLAPQAYNVEWVRNTKDNFSGGDAINIDLLKNFYKDSLPMRPVNVFLSAAAIPGSLTFYDANASAMKNKCFYVTVNPVDEMVTKNDIRNEVKNRYFFDIDFINAARLSSTTLGCNYETDADITKSAFDKKVGPKSRFKLKTVSDKWDHDIFTYIQETNYMKFLDEFLKEK